MIWNFTTKTGLQNLKIWIFRNKYNFNYEHKKYHKTSSIENLINFSGFIFRIEEVVYYTKLDEEGSQHPFWLHLFLQDQ